MSDIRRQLGPGYPAKTQGQNKQNNPGMDSQDWHRFPINLRLSLTFNLKADRVQSPDVSATIVRIPEAWTGILPIAA